MSQRLFKAFCRRHSQKSGAKCRAYPHHFLHRWGEETTWKRKSYIYGRHIQSRVEAICTAFVFTCYGRNKRWNTQTIPPPLHVDDEEKKEGLHSSKLKFKLIHSWCHFTPLLNFSDMLVPRSFRRRFFTHSVTSPTHLSNFHVKIRFDVCSILQPEIF